MAIYRIYDLPFVQRFWNEILRFVKRYAESKTNKVTAVSAQSTDVQYPSAKAVFDGLSAKADAMDIMFPNFNNLTPKKVFEYDVSDSAYHPLFSRANTNISTLMSEVNDIIKFRITVTGTNIYAVVDVIVRLHSSLATPSVMAWNNTYSVTAATTGITYLRVSYPKALNNGYDWLVEFSCYNATTRHIKVEVFEDTENITWIEEKVASTYNTTYQAGTNIYIYVYRGLNANNNWRLADAYCSSANSAAFISNYLPTWCAGTPPVAGEALLANQLVIMSNHKVYKATNKAIPIDCGCGVMIMGTTYAQDAAISYAYIRQKVSWTALTGDPLLTYDTFTKGEQVYLRCTLGEDGKIYPDGHLSNVMINGYTWVHIGTAASATAINLDTCGKPFITLGGNGYCTHVNGHPVGNPQITGDAAVGMWLERTSIGSNTGKGWLKKISGRSLVWNQLAENKAIVISGATYADGYTTIVLSNATSAVRMYAGFTQSGFLPNQKILVVSHVPYYNVANATLDKLRVTTCWNTTKGKTAAATAINYNDGKIVAALITLATNVLVTDMIGFYFDINGASSFSHTTSDSIVASYNIFNLTKMFGTGREPGIYDFLKMFPLGHYDYDTGRMIHGAVTGYKTTDAEDVQLSNLPISITTLTGKPAGSNTSEVIFPVGLGCLGDLKDEVDFETGKAIKRVGIVDIGSLNLTRTVSGARDIYHCPLPDAKLPASSGIAPNVLCNNYTPASKSATWKAGDVVLPEANTTINAGNIGFVTANNAFSDAASFKSAMSGEYFVYELATPVEYTLDTIPPTEIDVVKGGKEMWLPVHTSTPAIAPVDGKVQYGENIADVVRQLKESTSKWGVVSQKITWSGGTNGYTYSLSNIIQGVIPQNNIDLYEAAGAFFNATTGYFELNEVNDISYEEMSLIYAKSIGALPFLTGRNSQLAQYAQRTTVQLFFPAGYSTSINHMYAYSAIYIAYMNGCNNLGATQNAFNNCTKLKKVIGDLKATSWNNACFTNCYSLEYIHITNIKNDMVFGQSSKLELESIVFMVNNASNTSAITITLHGNAFARCQNDTTEYTYNNQTYTGILALATAKNITIVSA